MLKDIWKFFSVVAFIVPMVVMCATNIVAVHEAHSAVQEATESRVHMEAKIDALIANMSEDRYRETEAKKDFATVNTRLDNILIDIEKMKIKEKADTDK